MYTFLNTLVLETVVIGTVPIAPSPGSGVPAPALPTLGLKGPAKVLLLVFETAVASQWTSKLL